MESRPYCHGLSLQVKLGVFWDYAKAVGLWTALAICVLYTGQSAAAIGANMWLSAWTNEATVEGRQNNTTLRLGIYATLGMLQGEPAEAPTGAPGSPPLLWLSGSPNHAPASESPCLCTGHSVPTGSPG